MNIVNFQKLAKNSLRQKMLLIAEAGCREIEIPRVVRSKITLRKNLLIINSTSINGSRAQKQKLSLSNYQRIFLIGIGKGSALASATLAKILGGKLTGGIALDIQKPKLKIKNLKLKILTGTHPLPSQKNIVATQKIIKLASHLKKDDLLITFIDGGGSALLCGSEKELKYSQTIFKKLTEAGANILELNTVRKHLSEVKGGNLAKLAYPSTVISLIVSDVPTANNDLSMVASGPTVFDKTTKKDAEKILKKYLPHDSAFVLHLFRDLTETPKDRRYFKKVKNILFLSNCEPISAMAERAKELGFKPKIYSLKLRGEAKKALLPLMEVDKGKQIVLAGGETTVMLKSQISNLKSQKLGKGGRNQEAVLGALVNSSPISKNAVIMSFASDGRDNTEAAGAIGDILTLRKAKKLNLNPQEFLDNHDSFNFFKKIGDLIFTKRKTFNVADLMLILKL